MKVRFNIEYRTHWGENLYLNYSAEGHEPVQVPMTTTDGVVWSAEPELPDATINYYYHVEENGRQTRQHFLPALRIPRLNSQSQERTTLLRSTLCLMTTASARSVQVQQVLTAFT